MSTFQPRSARKPRCSIGGVFFLEEHTDRGEGFPLRVIGLKRKRESRTTRNSSRPLLGDQAGYMRTPDRSFDMRVNIPLNLSVGPKTYK